MYIWQHCVERTNRRCLYGSICSFLTTQSRGPNWKDLAIFCVGSIHISLNGNWLLRYVISNPLIFGNLGQSSRKLSWSLDNPLIFGLIYAEILFRAPTSRTDQQKSNLSNAHHFIRFALRARPIPVYPFTTTVVNYLILKSTTAEAHCTCNGSCWYAPRQN